MSAFITPLVGLSLLLTAWSAVSIASESEVTITPVEQWACLFGGQKVTLKFQLSDRNGNAPVTDGRLLWRYSADRRTLSRGEAGLHGSEPGIAEIPLKVPEVRDGVVFPTELSVSYVASELENRSSSRKKTLWLFPEDPFANQQQMLRELELSLFDPIGSTKDVFKKAGLACTQIRNRSALSGVSHDSCVIVGEGTSLSRNRGLAEQLVRFSAAGGSVLMLAPSDGMIPMPDEIDDRQPGAFRFRRHHVIRDFDKRLDSIAWPGSTALPGSRVSLKTRLGRIAMEVSENGNWPWIEIEYPETKGRYVFCGFRLIENWSQSPTPRYLLLEILKSCHNR